MTRSYPHDIAVFIGRFQPPHNGHLALLQQALALAEHVIVVLGSAYQARTPKNPFTWQERAEMIRLALPNETRDRVHFLPIRDYYNDDRWISAIRNGVKDFAQQHLPTGQAPNIALIGHFKDATSAYLQHFEGWALVSVERAGTIDAVHIRDALFGSMEQNIDATLAALTSVAPPSTLSFLHTWSSLPFVRALGEEWAMLKDYKAAWAAAPYPPVFVTVDAIVQCQNAILLIKRAAAPGKGLYALPGGFIEQRETVFQSALRELREETHLDLVEPQLRMALKSSAVFDHPDRSQRGRTISHAFYFDLGSRMFPEVQADDDAMLATWVPIAQLTSLENQFHDDHFHMLDHFLGLTTDPAN